MSHPFQNRRPLGPAAALLPGQALNFKGVVRGEERLCFAIRLPSDGSAPARFAGYLNVCAHRNQPVVADERHAFDAAGRIECRAHGAIYAPETGECIGGPCVGARLVPVTMECVDGELYALDDDFVDDSVYDE